MIRILYFGSLKTALGHNEETIDWQAGLDSQLLLEQLRNRGEDWQQALADNNIFRVVINQQVIYQTTPINDGDEVAILPPVTGG